MVVSRVHSLGQIAPGCHSCCSHTYLSVLSCILAARFFFSVPSTRLTHTHTHTHTHRDPRHRPSAQQALEHAWLLGGMQERVVGPQLDGTILQRLQRFGTESMFRRTVLDMIANDLLQRHLQQQHQQQQQQQQQQHHLHLHHLDLQPEQHQQEQPASPTPPFSSSPPWSPAPLFRHSPSKLQPATSLARAASIGDATGRVFAASVLAALGSVF